MGSTFMTPSCCACVSKGSLACCGFARWSNFSESYSCFGVLMFGQFQFVLLVCYQLLLKETFDEDQCLIATISRLPVIEFLGQELK